MCLAKKSIVSSKVVRPCDGGKIVFFFRLSVRSIATNAMYYSYLIQGVAADTDNNSNVTAAAAAALRSVM